MYSKKDLRLIHFKTPYYSLLYERNLALYSALKSFKVKGYYNDYGDKVMPIDITDEIGEHFLICIGTDDNLKILMATKSIRADVCESFNVKFPFDNISSLLSSEIDRVKVKKLIQGYNTCRENYSYDCSWTILPEIRERNPFLLMELLKIECSILYNFHHDDEINVPHGFLVGVLRQKTDKTFRKWGYKSISDSAIAKIPSLLDSECLLMHNSIGGFSSKAELWGSEFFCLWKNRLVIDDSLLIEEKEIIANAG